ncbi:MAG: RHS repeat-associated core domain-containing protein, partial [Patescibacteria group bacterium]
GTTPYGTFYNLLRQNDARGDHFTDTSGVEGSSTAEVEESGVISDYTTQTCDETLHTNNTTVSTTSGEFIEVKSWSFTLGNGDYRRELNVGADVAGYSYSPNPYSTIVSTGCLQVDLIRLSDGYRETILTGSKHGSGYSAIIWATKSLAGLAPGDYKISVMLKTDRHIAENQNFRVKLISKRVYSASSVLQTTAFTTDFDITQIALAGSVVQPSGASVTWTYSADGGTTWNPIDLGSPAPTDVTQPQARQIILKAVLTSDGTHTAFIDSYHLTVLGAPTGGAPGSEAGVRFTGKEIDETGLGYFGARYYDSEVGRFTTVDPARDGLNWYEYCSSNPVNRNDPNGQQDGSFNEIVTLPILIFVGDADCFIPLLTCVQVAISIDMEVTANSDSVSIKITTNAAATSPLDQSINEFGASISGQITIFDNGGNPGLFSTSNSVVAQTDPFAIASLDASNSSIALLDTSTPFLNGPFVLGIPNESPIDVQPDTLTVVLVITVIPCSYDLLGLPLPVVIQAASVSVDEPGGTEA